MNLELYSMDPMITGSIVAIAYPIASNSSNLVKAAKALSHLCFSSSSRWSICSFEAASSHAASVINLFSTHLKSPPAAY